MDGSDFDREFAQVSDYWSPRVVAIANGQYLKIAKVKGELVWHAHAEEDELFMVHRGTFGLRYRDGREVILRPDDFHSGPKWRRTPAVRRGGGADHLFRTGFYPAYGRCHYRSHKAD
jgi:cupin domain